MKHADPKVIWLAGENAVAASELALELQRYCRGRSIPAMVVDESRIGRCDDNDCLTGSGSLCRLAKTLAEQGYPVIVAAGYRQTTCQAWNRAHLPGYFEVHLLTAAGREASLHAPIAPDMRLAADDSERALAESIFEEVFGRGQLLPGSYNSSLLPWDRFRQSQHAF